MNNFKIKDIVEVEFDNKNDRIKGEINFSKGLQGL